MGIFALIALIICFILWLAGFRIMAVVLGSIVMYLLGS